MGMLRCAAETDDMGQLRLDAAAAMKFEDWEEPDQRELSPQLERELVTQQ